MSNQSEAEKQEPYCWTWDRWISGGTWRAEYGWKKPEQQVTNLQPLYTHPQPNVTTSDMKQKHVAKTAKQRHEENT